MRTAAWRSALAAAVIVVLGLAGCSDDGGDNHASRHEPTPTTAAPGAGRKAARIAKASTRLRARRFCEASRRFGALDALLTQRPTLARESIIRTDFEDLQMELVRSAPDDLERAASDVTVRAEARVAGRSPTGAEVTKADTAAKAIASGC